MKRDDRPEMQLPAGSQPQQGPFVDPLVAKRNPAAASYAAKVAERMGGTPRGGGPSPPIPPLHAPHREGMTMADQAPHGQPTMAPLGGIFTQPQQTAAPTNAAAASQGLLMADLLPEMARSDPQYMEGHASMYAVNQPKLAAKYGVIRNGHHVPPQQLQTGKPGLSSHTVEGIKAVEAFNQQRMSAERGETAAEAAASRGAADVGASTATLAGSGSEPVSEEQKAAAKEALNRMDDFDFNAFRELTMKDLLNSEEQRKIVESRLGPLDISTIIMNGRIQQIIPIRPGIYEPELQSLTGEEELALKRLLMEDKKTLGAPDQFLLDKFQLMTVACALRGVNRTVLPDFRNEQGLFDDQKFWAKFNKVLGLPFHMLASIGVHYFWFDIRVRKLFVAEQIKNG